MLTGIQSLCGLAASPVFLHYFGILAAKPQHLVQTFFYNIFETGFREGDLFFVISSLGNNTNTYWDFLFYLSAAVLFISAGKVLNQMNINIYLFLFVGISRVVGASLVYYKIVEQALLGMVKNMFIKHEN